MTARLNVAVSRAGGRPLNVSRHLLQRLQDFVALPDTDALPEEKDFAKQLYDDFSRFPCMEDVTDGQLVSTANIQPIGECDEAML